MYWPSPGPANTRPTLELALARAKELGIKHIVVASNTGETVEPLLEMGALEDGINLACVTHHVGYAAPGADQMARENRQRLAARGVQLLTTTHLFANVERAITNKFGGLYPGGIISHTLRTMGQGVKVAYEIAVMALDAGLIPFGEEVVVVAGTGRGADTAVVMLPSHAKTFFDTICLEIICKPRARR
ncbi:MAG: pyruvate kinase alpha/beta domain-containing protein [Bacillota bacterium]